MTDSNLALPLACGAGSILFLVLFANPLGLIGGVVILVIALLAVVSLVELLVHLPLYIHRANRLPFVPRSLVHDLMADAERSCERLAEAAQSCEHPPTKGRARALLQQTQRFLAGANKNARSIVREQRFVTYYLPQAISMLETHAALLSMPGAAAQDVENVESALRELEPVFIHFASKMEHAVIPDTGLELRLLRDAISEDVQKKRLLPR